MILVPPRSNLGELLSLSRAGSCQLSIHRGGALPRHEHESSYFCLVLGGRFLERSDKDDFTRCRGDAVFHPAGERHANDFGNMSALCLNLHVDAADFAAFAHTRRMNAGARSLAAELAGEIIGGNREDSLGQQCLEAELLGALRAEPCPRTGTSSIEIVMDALSDEPRRNWSLGELAALAGWHPTHLAREFRCHTGVSAGKWRRRHRALCAYADIRTTTRSFADIAQAHGFADQSHLTREVRLYAGRPPGALRRVR